MINDSDDVHPLDLSSREGEAMSLASLTLHSPSEIAVHYREGITTVHYVGEVAPEIVHRWVEYEAYVLQRVAMRAALECVEVDMCGVLQRLPRVLAGHVRAP